MPSQDEPDPEWEDLQAKVEQVMDQDELSLAGEYVGRDEAADDADVQAAMADDEDENEEEEEEEEGEEEENEENEEDEDEENDEEVENDENDEVEADQGDDDNQEYQAENVDDEVLPEDGAGNEFPDITEGDQTTDLSQLIAEEEAVSRDDSDTTLVDQGSDDQPPPELSASAGPEVSNPVSDASAEEHNPSIDSTEPETTTLSSKEVLHDSDATLTPEADTEFLESLAAEAQLDDHDGKEILAMTLTVVNKINGQSVLRPDKLGPNDRWIIEYRINEVESQTRAWNLYQSCQMRRQKKLDKSAAEGEVDSDNEPEEAPVNPYVKRLRELSADGRKWRDKQDEEEKKKPPNVLGEE